MRSAQHFWPGQSLRSMQTSPPCSMSTQEARAEAIDWLAIVQAERHDLIGELQRQLGLKPVQRNEAMRCGVRLVMRCQYAHTCSTDSWKCIAASFWPQRSTLRTSSAKTDAPKPHCGAKQRAALRESVACDPSMLLAQARRLLRAVQTPQRPRVPWAILGSERRSWLVRFRGRRLGPAARRRRVRLRRR